MGLRCTGGEERADPRGKLARAAVVGLAIVGATLVAVGPVLFKAEWPRGHEGARYGLLLDHFRDSLLKGHLYPRWLPDTNGGYGYPTFVFYQPGFFFLATCFSVLPGYPWSALSGSVTYLFIAGGVGAFLLCREFSGWRTALFCALLFLITPYLYVNLYVRGDLSELMATLLCPWPFFFLARLERRFRSGGFIAGSVAGAALSLGLVVISHPLTALFLFAAFCLIAAHTGLGQPVGRRLVFLVCSATAVVLGAALSAPYWLVASQMRYAVNLDAAFRGQFLPVHHLVYVPQFFSNAWGYEFSIAGDRDDMSFQLGLPHFALATCGAFCAPRGRLIGRAYGVYLALILLMTPIAQIAWDALPILHVVQFPWRILSVTATLQLICCAGLHHIPESRHIRRDVLLPVLLWSTALWHSNQFVNLHTIDINRFCEEHRALPFDPKHYTIANEFLPRTAQPDRLIPWRPRMGMLMLAGEGEAAPLPGNSAHRIRYQISCGSPTIARLHQLYFPGWRVELDGHAVPTRILEASARHEGLILVPIRRGGTHTVEAYYEGPPGWKLCRTLSLLALFALGGMTLGERIRVYRRTAGGRSRNATWLRGPHTQGAAFRDRAPEFADSRVERLETRDLM